MTTRNRRIRRLRGEIFITPRSHRIHLMVLGAVDVACGLVALLSFGAFATTWQLRAQGWYLDMGFDELRRQDDEGEA